MNCFSLLFLVQVIFTVNFWLNTSSLNKGLYFLKAYWAKIQTEYICTKKKKKVSWTTGKVMQIPDVYTWSSKTLINSWLFHLG